MVRIYHNNRCSKSRATLALLEEHGGKVEVINYLDTPPDASELAVLLKQFGMTPRELARVRLSAAQAREAAGVTRAAIPMAAVSSKRANSAA